MQNSNKLVLILSIQYYYTSISTSGIQWAPTPFSPTPTHFPRSSLRQKECTPPNLFHLRNMKGEKSVPPHFCLYSYITKECNFIQTQLTLILDNHNLSLVTSPCCLPSQLPFQSVQHVCYSHASYTASEHVACMCTVM